MSHVPGNLIYKRWLNALKSPSGKVNPGPPSGVLRIFDGETASPVPPNTVMGFAATTRNNFLALTTLTVDQCETFEAYTAGDLIESVAVPSGVSGALTNGMFAAANGLGRFNTNPTAGTIHADVQSGPGEIITFSTNLAGFGWFITDAGDFNAQWSMTVVDQFNVTTVYQIHHSVGSPSGNLVFWGFIDSTGLLYKSVQITGTDVRDGIGVDGVYLVRTADLITP